MNVKLDVVMHTYNPNYLGGKGYRIQNSKPALAKLRIPFLKSKMQIKRFGGMSQVVENLPNMIKALCSISNV
jgi:hypothetical protein